MEETPRKMERAVAGMMIDMVEDEDKPKVYVGGKAPMSYDQYYEDEEGGSPDNAIDCDEEEIDDEIIEHDRKNKESFKRALYCEEDYYAEPDLHGYFSQFPGMEDFTIIAMCRTYANYLAQKLKSRGGVGQGTKKSKTKK